MLRQLLFYSKAPSSESKHIYYQINEFLVGQDPGMNHKIFCKLSEELAFLLPIIFKNTLYNK